MEHILKAKILLIDDEENLLKMITALLESVGFYNIITATNKNDAIEVLKNEELNIILLDIMLGRDSGFDLYQDINTLSDAPIIFLSARDEDTSKLRGLGLGADDYITKPFLPRELILRVSAVLRRTYKESTSKVSIGSVAFDTGTAIISKGGKSLKLTATEYKILTNLIENKGTIVTIDSLCASVWQDGDFGYQNTLMVHIRRLREKIEDNPSKPIHLITVRGLGYRLFVGDCI